MTCALCDDPTAPLVKCGPMSVCPACRALVEQEAGRRMRLIVTTLVDMSEEEAERKEGVPA